MFFVSETAYQPRIGVVQIPLNTSQKPHGPESENFSDLSHHQMENAALKKKDYLVTDAGNFEWFHDARFLGINFSELTKLAMIWGNSNLTDLREWWWWWWWWWWWRRQIHYKFSFDFKKNWSTELRKETSLFFLVWDWLGGFKNFGEIFSPMEMMNILTKFIFFENGLNWNHQLLVVWMSFFQSTEVQWTSNALSSLKFVVP